MKPVLLMNLPPRVLHPSPLQMRVEIDASNPKFLDLLHSVEEKGQHDPIKARPHPTIAGEYEVGDGNSRVLAIKMLNERPAAAPRAVSVLVGDYSDEEMMWLQRDENVVHQGISDYEDARWLGRMINDFLYTQATLAEKCRRSPQWVSQHLKMLDLEPYLSQRTLNRMTEYQARIILEASGDLIPHICERIEKDYKKEDYLPSAQVIRDSIIPMMAAMYEPVLTGVKPPEPESIKIPEDASPILELEPSSTETMAEETPPVKVLELEPTQTSLSPGELEARKERVGVFLRTCLPKHFKPEEQGGELGWIKHRLKGEGLSDEEAGQAIQDQMRRIGLIPEKVKPRSLDLHRSGRGCPVCGRTLDPETYDRLAKKFKIITLDDFKGLWQ